MPWCRYRSQYLCDLKDPKPYDCYLCTLNRFVDTFEKLVEAIEKLAEAVESHNYENEDEDD